MGWTNNPLHRFIIHGKAYGIVDAGGGGFDADPTQIRVVAVRCRLRAVWGAAALMSVILFLVLRRGDKREGEQQAAGMG